LTAELIHPNDLTLIQSAERGMAAAQACHRFTLDHVFAVYKLAPGDAFDSASGLIHRKPTEEAHLAE